MQITAEFLIGTHLAYQFLGGVLVEPPSQALIETLVTNDLFEDWPLDAEQDEIRTGLALLRAFCRDWDDSQFAPIKRDYTRLFIGPEHVVVPLWESVYRSPDHLLFDTQTLEVRRAYQRFGMETPGPNVEPEDQLGLELRFIAYLCRLALAAMGQDQPETLSLIVEAMRAFLDEHLLLWASDCLHLLIQNAETPFYRGIGHLTLGCLAEVSEVVHLEAVR